MQIRVALTITTLNVGGAERQLTYLASYLQAAGCDVMVFVLADQPQPPRDHLLLALVEQGIAVEFANARSWRHAPRVVRQLANRLDSFRPHVTQAFLAHANVASAIAAKLTGISHIVTGIRVADDRPNGHKLAARLTQSMAAHHVACSDEVAQFAASRMGIPADRMTVIPNGVDPGLAKRRPLVPLPAPLDPNAPLMLVPGRLEGQKRPLWVLDGCGQIIDQLPGTQIAFVGDGPLRKELEARIAAHPRKHSIHVLGHSCELPELMHAADLVLSGSAWEGMPNVLLEAMACGKAFVATAAEGVRALAGSSADEQSVPIDDREGWVRQAVRLARDPALRASLAAFNQQRALGEFSLESMGSRYLALYRALIARGNR